VRVSAGAVARPSASKVQVTLTVSSLSRPATCGGGTKQDRTGPSGPATGVAKSTKPKPRG